MKPKISTQTKSALMEASKMVIQKLRHLRMFPSPARLRILKHVVPAALKLDGGQLKRKLQQNFALSLNLFKARLGIQTKQRAPRPARKRNHQEKWFLGQQQKEN